MNLIKRLFTVLIFLTTSISMGVTTSYRAIKNIFITGTELEKLRAENPTLLIGLEVKKDQIVKIKTLATGQIVDLQVFNNSELSESRVDERFTN